MPHEVLRKVISVSNFHCAFLCEHIHMSVRILYEHDLAGILRTYYYFEHPTAAIYKTAQLKWLMSACLCTVTMVVVNKSVTLT